MPICDPAIVMTVMFYAVLMEFSNFVKFLNVWQNDEFEAARISSNAMMKKDKRKAKLAHKLI